MDIQAVGWAGTHKGCPYGGARRVGAFGDAGLGAREGCPYGG